MKRFWTHYKKSFKFVWLSFSSSISIGSLMFLCLIIIYGIVFRGLSGIILALAYFFLMPLVYEIYEIGQ